MDQIIHVQKLRRVLFAHNSQLESKFLYAADCTLSVHFFICLLRSLPLKVFDKYDCSSYDNKLCWSDGKEGRLPSL